MNALEILLEALKHYEIEVLSVNDTHVRTQNNYEIEIEQSGIYKLSEDGYIVGPFDDLDELCRFIRM